jgi:glucose/arabinose dehydrogenase
MNPVFLALLLLVGFSTSSDVFALPIKKNGYKLAKAYPNIQFSKPIDFQDPTGADTRFFVAEQGGVIRAFSNQKNVSSSDVYLDIQSKISSPNDEEGLLGFVFHPQYESNGYVYVNYTASSPLRNVIARYQRDASNPLIADPDSELVLLEYNQPFNNHNGGQIAFGPDGYLYIASGDGGSGGDPQGNAQNLGSLLGKILRIDVDTTQGLLNYSIPSTNPFVGTSGAEEEIFAYGLRNPWRISFDSANGRLWAGDVGQDAREEINIVKSGRNYGWNVREGKICYFPSTGCSSSGFEKPVFDYKHSEGQSITGGFVYRGNKFSELKKHYLYADFVSGRVWALEATSSGKFKKNTQLLDSNILISSFGRTTAKELFVLGYDTGLVYRLKRK